MRNLKFLSFFLCTIFLISSCTKDICTKQISYIKETAIYGDLDQFRSPIKNEKGIAIENPGKVFVHENYLFIGDEDKGIHVIDNEDPTSPVSVNYISIPGNKEMIINDNLLYVDSYYDILVLDINDPEQITLLSRNKEVFPISLRNELDQPLIGFKSEAVEEKVECYIGIIENDRNFFDWGNNLIPPSTVPSSFAGSTQANGNNLSGSLSRMAIAEKNLYLINNRNLLHFNIEPSSLSFAGEHFIDFNIETLFEDNGRLFMGSQNGMFIFDINDPSNPRGISRFNHQASCDPVFPTSEFAYVTLRTGNECEGSVNVLEIVSLQDITRPTLVNSIQMSNPHGLTMVGNKLIVSEGTDGLKIFDATNPSEMSYQNLLKHLTSFDAYDVIADPNDPSLLLIIGNDELIQYQLSEENDLSLLSQFSL